MKKFGFIGAGNMGGAIARAVARVVEPGDILVATLHREKAEAFAQAMGAQATDNATLAKSVKYLVLGVKPQYLEDVFSDIRPALGENPGVVLVSMAAGISMAALERMAGRELPIVRIMPNTPAAVGQGVVLYDHNSRLSGEDLQELRTALAPAGILDALPERLMDAGTAVAGCGPAYACLFLEALADGGVACGLPRAKALEYAAQTMLGTAKLVLESGQHPGQLKDAVCSPGGSTIQGVRALEQRGLRSALLEAVIAAYNRNKEFES